MKHDERFPLSAFRGGMIPWAGAAAALGLMLVLGGCEKIRDAVEKAASKSEQGEEASDPDAAVAGGLGELEAAQQGRMAAAAGGGTEIRQLGAAEFDSFVGRGERLVVVDFYADWCGPCRALAPVLESICRELGPRVSLGKVDVDRHKELAGRMGVRSIPDVRVYRGGRKVDSFVGMLPEEQLRARLRKHHAALPALEESAGGTGGEAGQEKKGTIVPMEKGWTPSGMERR